MFPDRLLALAPPHLAFVPVAKAYPPSILDESWPPAQNSHRPRARGQQERKSRHRRRKQGPVTAHKGNSAAPRGECYGQIRSFGPKSLVQVERPTIQHPPWTAILVSSKICA